MLVKVYRADQVVFMELQTCCVGCFDEDDVAVKTFGSLLNLDLQAGVWAS